MSLQEKPKESKALLVVVIGLVVIIGLILLAVVGYLAYAKYAGDSSAGEKPVQAEAKPPETTTTVGRPSGIVKSLGNLYADLTGGRACGTDRECFDEAAVACKKASHIFDTGRVVQKREVLGKSGDKCEVYYEITDVKDPQVTSTDWVGLNMTCRLDPADISQDILSVVKPECSGSLWDKLASFQKK